jgi:hypothetical protein
VEELPLLTNVSLRSYSLLVGEYFIVIPDPFPGGGIKIRLWRYDRGYYVMSNLYCTGELVDLHYHLRDGPDPQKLLADFLDEKRAFLERVPVSRIVANSGFFQDWGTGWW